MKLLTRFGILCMSLVLLLSVAACGGLEDSSSASDPNTSTEVSDSLIPVPEGTPVTNEAELLAIANDLSGQYYLENDIALTVPVVPIGGGEKFKGILNGNNHTISGLTFSSEIVNYYDETDDEYDAFVGLFEVNNGTICNLNVQVETSLEFAFAQSTKIYVGAVCGYNKNGTLANVKVTGSISVTEKMDSALRIGGIAGKIKNAVTDCAFAGKIMAKTEMESLKAGGIAGMIEEGSALRCTANAEIEATSGKSLTAGCLFGTIDGVGIVQDCSATGKVKGTADSKKSSCVAGLIGYVGEDGEDAVVADVTVKNCTAEAEAEAISVGGNACGAGIVGRCELATEGGKIAVRGCKVLGGKVTASAGDKAYAGTIAGRIDSLEEGDISIVECFYASALTCEVIAGKDKSEVTGELLAE